ncbi:MAG: hypothetical protein SGPRY_012301 [Prymnesium sp.]
MKQWGQHVFRSVLAEHPDLWLWTGDVVYPDWPSSETEIEQAYSLVGESEEERALLADVPLVDGVFDDHDFGENDGGSSNVHRDLARRLFLDRVVRAHPNSPRRSQEGGLYTVRTFGLPPHQLKLLLLDTRFARDDHALPSPGGVWWLPKPGYCAALVRLACAVLGVGRDHAGAMLSPAQWAWLERELTNSTAAAHLIVSSVQVLTSSPVVESWGHFPRERDKLLHMLATLRPPGALLISGDVHYAELLGLGSSHEGEGKLLEVTSSGLTHSCGNSYFGRLLCGVVMRSFSGHRLLPGDPLRAGGWADSFVGSSYLGINFGTVQFDWDGTGAPGENSRGPSMHLQLHGENGSVVLASRLPLGLDAEEEAARWLSAQALPTVFDAAATVRMACLGGGLFSMLLCLLAQLYRRGWSSRASGGKKSHAQ